VPSAAVSPRRAEELPAAAAAAFWLPINWWPAQLPTTSHRLRSLGEWLLRCAALALERPSAVVDEPGRRSRLLPPPEGPA